MPSDAPYWEAHSVDPAALTDSDKQSYKKLSSFAAKGVAVVTAVQGRWDQATVVTDYLSVSYDPPTMLVSLYSLSRMAEAFVESGRWGVSLLASNQRNVAEALGEQASPLPRLLDRIPHFRTGEGTPALIVGSLCWFDLRTTHVTVAATHTLFVGEVTAMGRSAEFGALPLTRFQSGYLRSK